MNCRHGLTHNGPGLEVMKAQGLQLLPLGMAAVS